MGVSSGRSGAVPMEGEAGRCGRAAKVKYEGEADGVETLRR